MYEEQLSKTPDGGDFGIRSIAEDDHGFYWICNTDFKYKVLLSEEENHNLSHLNLIRKAGLENESTGTMYFLSMITDKQGDIWMVSYDDGVWQNTGEELIHHPVEGDECEIYISSIYKDKAGELWIGTQNNGAYKFNGKAFEKFEL